MACTKGTSTTGTGTKGTGTGGINTGGINTGGINSCFRVYVMTERIHTAHGQNQRRMALSIAIALFIHAGIFVTFQYLPHPEELPEYSGPITVTLYESNEQMRATEAQAAAAQRAALQPEKRPETKKPETIRPESVQKTPEVAQRTTDVVQKTRGQAEAIQKSTKTYESQAAKAPENLLPKPQETAGPLPVPVQERPLGTEGPVEEAVNVPSGRIQAPTRGMATQEARPSPQTAPSTQETTGAVSGTAVAGRAVAGKAVAGTTPEAAGEEQVSRKEKFSFPPVEAEEKPLSLDMERLEQALEKTATGSTEETRQKTAVTGTPSTGAPKIEWEDARRGRTLLSSPTLPVIPEWVKREGLNLTVAVTFEVTPQGHATGLNVEQSSGYSDVDSVVLEAVRKLQFNPIADNKNVRGTIRYIISTR